jgi:hypothetical protein
MSPAAMAQQCADNINSRAAIGLSAEDAAILVVTPKGWKAPPKFPRGEIVQWKEDGSRVRYLPALRTLAWLSANFDIKVETKS